MPGVALPAVHDGDPHGARQAVADPHIQQPTAPVARVRQLVGGGVPRPPRSTHPERRTPRSSTQCPRRDGRITEGADEVAAVADTRAAPSRRTPRRRQIAGRGQQPLTPPPSPPFSMPSRNAKAPTSWRGWGPFTSARLRRQLALASRSRLLGRRSDASSPSSVARSRRAVAPLPRTPPAIRRCASPARTPGLRALLLPSSSFLRTRKPVLIIRRGCCSSALLRTPSAEAVLSEKLGSPARSGRWAAQAAQGSGKPGPLGQAGKARAGTASGSTSLTGRS